MTEEEREIIIDKETSVECNLYRTRNYPDTFKVEYPKGDIEDYYIDQSMSSVLVADRRISSFYTPHGIRQIDSWFAKQIRKGSKFSKEELEQMVRRNPHLHNVIKSDLLSNLKNHEIRPI